MAPVANEVANETALQLAVHQFTAEYVVQVGAFFDRFVPRGVTLSPPRRARSSRFERAAPGEGG